MGFLFVVLFFVVVVVGGGGGGGGGGGVVVVVAAAAAVVLGGVLVLFVSLFCHELFVQRSELTRVREWRLIKITSEEKKKTFS